MPARKGDKARLRATLDRVLEVAADYMIEASEGDRTVMREALRLVQEAEPKRKRVGVHRYLGVPAKGKSPKRPSIAKGGAS